MAVSAATRGAGSSADSLALLPDDLDAPDGHFIHWLAWNIPAVKHLPEARAAGEDQGAGGVTRHRRAYPRL